MNNQTETIKKEILSSNIFILLCFIFMLAVVGITNNSEEKRFEQKTKNIYPETGIIIEIENDVVTVKTGNGNCFQFDGKEDYEVNDIVSMLMYDNNTANIEDDIILKTEYSGL